MKQHVLWRWPLPEGAPCLKGRLSTPVAAGNKIEHALPIAPRSQPANVLVTAEGLLKLGDLGLGRQLGPQTVELVSKVG
jgi:hypothetical protein